MLLHFVLVGDYFYYTYYLAALTAKKKLNVQNVILWTTEDIKDNHYLDLTREIIDVRHIDDPKELHPDGYDGKGLGATIADYLRLDKLYEYGGIYLDLDTLTIRDFSFLLDGYEAVISAYYPEGCFTNGVLMCAPKSKFMRVTKERCKSILHETKHAYEWSAAGTRVIDDVYGCYNKEKIRVCPLGQFIWFKWDNVRVFEENDMQIPETAFVLHYYGMVAYNIEREMTPNWIKYSNSLYARTVKTLLTEEEWEAR